MRWLETLAIGIFVYEVTTSALLVALMTIARQLPLALFGSFIGPFAERFNRKHLYAWFHRHDSLSFLPRCVCLLLFLGNMAHSDPCIYQWDLLDA